MTFKEKNREAYKFFILAIHKYYQYKDIFQTEFLHYYGQPKKNKNVNISLLNDLIKVFCWKNKYVAGSSAHYKTVCNWLNKLVQAGWLNTTCKLNPITNRTAICYRINKRKVKECHLEEWQKEYIFLKLKGEI